MPGQFGAAVVPIGAEATASGYEVAWKTMGTDQYSVWATDKNGNYTSNIVGTASGTSTTLESIETSFHQDLNGDGQIGVVLNGSSGGQTLTATGATTTLIGGPNDILNGGAGADTFVFPAIWIKHNKRLRPRNGHDPIWSDDIRTWLMCKAYAADRIQCDHRP